MTRLAPVAVAAVILLSSCGGSAASVGAFCDQMVTMREADQKLADVDLSDSDAVTAALLSFRREFEELAEVSPEAVAADSEIVARFGGTVAEAAIRVETEDPFDRAAVMAAATASEPELERALERLATYTSRRCTPAP